MKKVFCLIFSILFLMGTSGFYAASAPFVKDSGTPAAQSLDELLAPYQAVVDKLNRELGMNLYIPDKQRVYNHVKSKTPAELEAELRAEAKTADPDYREKSKTGKFIKSSAMENNKYDKYYKFTVNGEKSPVILLPNAEGTLKVTPLE